MKNWNQFFKENKVIVISIFILLIGVVLVLCKEPVGGFLIGLGTYRLYTELGQ